MIFQFEIANNTIAVRAVKNIAEFHGWTEIDGPPSDVKEGETKAQYGLRKWKLYPLYCSLTVEPKKAGQDAAKAMRDIVNAQIEIIETAAAEKE